MMRKILLIVLCLLMCGAIYYIYESYSSVEVEKKIELDGIAYIEKYYVLYYNHKGKRR